MTTFADLGVPSDVVRALAKRGIESPFPVQEATIADMLDGRDVCGKAPTGSGKTLAFGIPLVVKVEPARPRRPRALVLAPTRELAAQITKELTPLAAARDKRVYTVYGGVGYEPQKQALRKGVDILVACPGRLRDLLNQKAIRLDAIDIVVIDEADRMADMGFLPEVRKLLDETAEDRQTVLFSATLDGDVALLTREYQSDPVTHEVAGLETDAADVEHHFEMLDAGDRIERTAEIVHEHGQTIVFTRTRHGAEKVAKQLQAAGVDAAAIHGGLSQAKRDRALAGFKSAKVEALIATDVAARGIHVDAVACVVHFDPPVDTKTYIHRSGRTARAGATGVVFSFVARDQRKAARKLQQELGLLESDPAPERAKSRRRDDAPRSERPRRDRDDRPRSERPRREFEEGARSERPRRDRDDRPRSERPRREFEEGARSERPRRDRDDAPRSERPRRDGAARPAKASGSKSTGARGPKASSGASGPNRAERRAHLQADGKPVYRGTKAREAAESAPKRQGRGRQR